MSIRLMVGDCRSRLAELDPDSIDSCVTDPPYHLTVSNRGSTPRSVAASQDVFARVKRGGFMGKSWDGGDVAFQPETWQAVLRVMKPGAYLLAFGGTRTFHRLTCAIEDAGFEIHDCISWPYGSGFPKHQSKLKPAWEPIIVARKPAPRATPLQIDACRIGYRDDGDKASATPQGRVTSKATHVGAEPDAGRDEARLEFERPELLGRWPANVVMDEDAAARLDAAAPKTGALAKVTGNHTSRTGESGIYNHYDAVESFFHGDGLAGASRFFYCAKASRAEREAGLKEVPTVLVGRSRAAAAAAARGDDYDNHDSGFNKTVRIKNTHPTVKPLALMRWLVTLVTPPGGTILDPFLGSGTTGLAALRENFSFIGCELLAEYTAIAEARLRSEQPLFADVTVA